MNQLFDQKAPAASPLERDVVVVKRPDASAYDIHYQAEADVFELDRLTDLPSFYPVYRNGRYFAASPLPLLLLKKRLVLDRQFLRENSITRSHRLAYTGGNRTIDAEISRVGGPANPGRQVIDREDLAVSVAEALKADAAYAESRLPGFTHVILCGGKDSLNLLLLPWKNPVIVASADPNYPLVQEFVRRNELSYPVQKVGNGNGLFARELLANCCLLDLRHCRWSEDLHRLAVDLQKRCVLWQGSLGDVFLTTYWQSYRVHRKNLNVFSRKLARAVSALNPERALRQALYFRGGMWQGAHHALLRTVVDVPVLSGYHGPALRDVLDRITVTNSVREDVRARIGHLLKGSEVWYPTDNPSPPPLGRDRGDDPSVFQGELARLGIAIERV